MMTFLAALFERSAQRVRGDHGIAAGIVGNREASKRGSAARVWAMSSTRLPPRSARVPRDVTSSTQVIKRTGLF